mmetsp:Transcript_38222/g.83912  ORF Transcript_38222/g.83912 Transcript_38222/m.83912 type:complete len:209 (-) Transcript_38222:88-714(-)
MRTLLWAELLALALLNSVAPAAAAAVARAPDVNSPISMAATRREVIEEDPKSVMDEIMRMGRELCETHPNHASCAQFRKEPEEDDPATSTTSSAQSTTSSAQTKRLSTTSVMPTTSLPSPPKGQPKAERLTPWGSTPRPTEAAQTTQPELPQAGKWKPWGTGVTAPPTTTLPSQPTPSPEAWRPWGNGASDLSFRRPSRDAAKKQASL